MKRDPWVHQKPVGPPNRVEPLWPQQSRAQSRVREALCGAWQNGYDTAERVFYMQGWRWGCLCGVLAGLMVAALMLLLGQWVQAQGWL
jgi:hypothetical protein